MCSAVIGNLVDILTIYGPSWNRAEAYQHYDNTEENEVHGKTNCTTVRLPRLRVNVAMDAHQTMGQK